MPAFVKIGVIGLGRMGLLYTRILATQIAGARLHAVAEVDGRARSKVADDLAISLERSQTLPALGVPQLDLSTIRGAG